MKLARAVPLLLAVALACGLMPAFAGAPAVRRLSIQAPSREMTVGGESSSMRLSAVATPSDADISRLTWSSKKPKVAEVDESGLVTALSAGKAGITVTDPATGRSASKTIRVWVLPESVALTVSEKTIKAGRTCKLTARLSPASGIRKADRALTWFSSDSSVASVNARGRVKALSPGCATITVMTANGLTDVCEITVSE